MAIDDPFHQAQAKPRALDRGRPRRIPAVEALEDAWNHASVRWSDLRRGSEIQLDGDRAARTNTPPYPYADVRTEVTPKQAQVYVDGYYAGVASDFDGVFKRLHLTPGGHAVTLYLEGYRTVTQDVYVRPDSTFKLNESMERLSAGETSEPPPLPVTRPDRFALRPRHG